MRIARRETFSTEFVGFVRATADTADTGDRGWDRYRPARPTGLLGWARLLPLPAGLFLGDPYRVEDGHLTGHDAPG